MRRTLGLFLLFVAAALPARAAPPTAESVQTLLGLVKADALIQAMANGIDTALRRDLVQFAESRPLSPDQQHDIEAVFEQYSLEIRAAVSWDALMSIYVRVYQDTFTQEEIDGLIAFYRGPLGTAVIEKVPLAARRSMEVMQPRLQEIVLRMKNAVDQKLRDAKPGGRTTP